MIFFEVLLIGLGLVLLVPVLFLFSQVMFALLPERPSPVEERRPSAAVLVPAHNEDAGIVGTLHSVLPQLRQGDRLLVVADNCSDHTAAVAAKSGAEVVERRDAMQRGKGFALDFGLRHLALNPPEVVIIVDADCLVEAEAINGLARKCAHTGRPVQALDLMCSSPQSGLKTRIGELAWRVKNWVRPLGSLRMGLPCQLMGTGMAIPWNLLDRVNVAHGGVVEDMQLGIDLALAGYQPLFWPEGRVLSRFPEAGEAVETQRTRWEHGHLGMIAQGVPPLLRGAWSRRDARLLAMALDLAVPPLAFLALALLVAASASLLAFWAGLSLGPLVVTGCAALLFGFAILVAWHGWGRDVVSLAGLLSVPVYVLSKLPMYLHFWTRRQQEWVRTERGAGKKEGEGRP